MTITTAAALYEPCAVHLNQWQSQWYLLRIKLENWKREIKFNEHYSPGQIDQSSYGVLKSILLGVKYEVIEVSKTEWERHPNNISIDGSRIFPLLYQ